MSGIHPTFCATYDMGPVEPIKHLDTWRLVNGLRLCTQCFGKYRCIYIHNQVLPETYWSHLTPCSVMFVYIYIYMYISLYINTSICICIYMYVHSIQYSFLFRTTQLFLPYSTCLLLARIPVQRSGKDGNLNQCWGKVSAYHHNNWIGTGNLDLNISAYHIFFC